MAPSHLHFTASAALSFAGLRLSTDARPMRAVKTFSRALLLVGLIGWASIGLGAAAEPQAAIDAWLATRSGGIAVALVRDDAVTFHAAGFHSASDPRPVGPDAANARPSNPRSRGGGGLRGKSPRAFAAGRWR